MTDSRYPISGSIRIWFVAEGGLANEEAPTAVEVNAGLDISDAVSWNDKDFGVSASNTANDPAITAKGNVSDRGAAQYGGGLSLYYPRDRSDITSVYVLAEQALGTPGTRGYLIVRVDGVELPQTTGTAANPGTLAAAGDFVNVFKIETAGYAQAITGEEAFRYTVSFLSKGFVKTFAIVRAAGAAVAPEIAGTLTATVGGHTLLTASLLGRDYTRGVEWTSVNPGIASVSRNGVVTGITAGSATIRATDPATGASDTAEVVVSA